MNEYLLGAATMGFAVSGLFFFRFWRQTHDRLFLIFATSFWLLGLNRFILALLGDDQHESDHQLHLLRLVAYLALIIAILDKNRSSANVPESSE